jgi:hypothetical protein
MGTNKYPVPRSPPASSFTLCIECEVTEVPWDGKLCRDCLHVLRANDRWDSLYAE